MCGMSGYTSNSRPLSFRWPLALLLLLPYSVLDLFSQLPIFLCRWSLCRSLTEYGFWFVTGKKKRQPRKRRLVVNSTFMLPEQKLYLHENQTGKGVKHGDFETRFPPIPWEAQKSGSHCQLPVSVFQPYFQHRLDFFATTFGSYSPFLEREAYGNAWQSLRFCSPEVVNTITTSSSPESAPASSQGQPQTSLQSALAVLSKALQDPRFFPRRFAGC